MRLMKSTRCRQRKVEAFTLMEVIMASVIGAIIFIALFSGMQQGYTLIQHQRESLRASQVIVGRLERLRLCAWTTNQLFSTNIVPPTFIDYFYPIGLGGFPATNVIYTGTMDITTNFVFLDASGGVATTQPSYSNKMARVTVNVRWSSDYRNGRSNVYYRSMKTYIAQWGEQNYMVKVP